MVRMVSRWPYPPCDGAKRAAALAYECDTMHQRMCRVPHSYVPRRGGWRALLRGGLRGEAGGAHVDEAALLVGALVVADLAEQVGQAPVLAVLRRVAAGVGLGLQLGVLSDIGHVLVLGVVLEVGVEPVAPFRTDHEEQPGHVVEEERDQPRRQPGQQERLPQP